MSERQCLKLKEINKLNSRHVIAEREMETFV